MRHPRPCLALCSALCLVYGGLQSQTAPVSPPRCTVPMVGSPDSAWRQVRASGFTFCVPASWTPSGRAKDSVDAPQWPGNGTSVTWGLGRPRFGTGRSATTEMRGKIVGRGSGIVGPPPVITHNCEPPTNTPFTVDGGVVMITKVQCEGVDWTATGWSTTPAIYVQGEAHTAELADLLVHIMRTIRFTSPP
jgi:hypothetical protein